MKLTRILKIAYKFQTIECYLSSFHNKMYSLELSRYYDQTQMKLLRRILIITVLIIPVFVQGQTVCSEESRQKLDSMLHKIAISDLHQKPINKVVVELGRSLLNTPYVEKTLEVPGNEPLVINMIGLDCTTYLESIVTLARLTKKGKYTFLDYEQELEFVRYRDGKRKHYPSRLHYFSDWIYESQQKGIADDVTKSIGGVHYENNPSFMSSNPKYYAQLSNADYVEEIKHAETDITKRKYYYIPKESVEKYEANIQAGDLIAITIAMDNLDISHVGIAVEQGGRIHLMHASSIVQKVVISDKPLSEYLMGNKKQSGIMVSRLSEPGN